MHVASADGRRADSPAGCSRPPAFPTHPVLTVPLHPQVPMARASILWLIGEYCEHVPRIAPDVLRKMAKSFTAEEDIVKLQVINLAAKLYLTNSKQVRCRGPRSTPVPINDSSNVLGALTKQA